MTELQRRFRKSRIRKRAVLEIIAGEGLDAAPGGMRNWYSVISASFNDMPEAQIKRCLYAFLQCRDVTDGERKEIIQILQGAETALTADQLQQIAFSLQDE